MQQSNQNQHVFFPHGPPPYAPAPADPALVQRIQKLAEYAARNGPTFVEQVRSKQHGNPEYSFLHGGDGVSFFNWTLYTALNPPQPQNSQHPAPPVAPNPPPSPPIAQQDTSADLATLPSEVSSGWNQVLDVLTGSRDSIRASQGWFLACAAYAPGMAELMLQRVLSSSSSHDTQVHMVYLANDILFKAHKEGGQGQGAGVAAAFKPRLGRMLRKAYLSGSSSPEVQIQQKLARVVGLWSEKGIYDTSTTEQMVMEMMGIAPIPPPQQHQEPQQIQIQHVQAGFSSAAVPAAITPSAPWNNNNNAPQQQPLAAGGGGPVQQLPEGVQNNQQQHQQQYYHPGFAQHQTFQHPHQQYQLQQQGMMMMGAGGAYLPPPHGTFPVGSTPYPPYSPHPHMYPHHSHQSYQQPGYFPQQQPPPPHMAPHGGMNMNINPSSSHYNQHHQQQGYEYEQHQQQQQQQEQAENKEEEESQKEGNNQEAEGPAFDPMSFPPGLIPKLVEERMQTGTAYTPLDPVAIESSELPPPPNLDAYLKARVDKLYAQLADYRPGMLFSDIEQEAARHRHFTDRPAPGPVRPTKGGVDATGAPLDDGSGPAGLGPGSRARGLGYGNESSKDSEGLGDEFSAYRHIRSQGYHSFMSKAAAGKKYRK